MTSTVTLTSTSPLTSTSVRGRTITAHERARRAHLVSLARLGVEVEGRRGSAAARALQDAYVRGELELDDLVARTQGTAAAHG